MSGSGNGNSGGRWSGGNFDSPCEQLDVTTQVHSPNEVVVQRLSIGDLLEISLHIEDGEESVVVVHEGDNVGAVIHERLRECISSGIIYQAEVTEIDDSLVRVRITKSIDSR